MYRLICQKPAHFLSTQMALVSTLLYKMPSNIKGKNFVSKFPGYCPQNTMVFFSSKLDGIKKYFCRQYLQNLNALIFWFKYLQKVNAKCPQISDEKKSFASLTNNFWSFKKQIKKYLSMEQNLCFFSSEIWGHCIYFLQVLKSEYEGIYILQVLPSNCILPSDLKD